ncbi:MAG: peptidase T [Victivallales bacterium]|nr:peptidase T [Victivallales bacterium]MCF7889032.1 peptidase T [Victivallales bacterium]
MDSKLLDKFLKYVKVDTQSSDDSKSFPSTDKQFDLAELLVEELKTQGLKDAEVDKNCYVTATLKSNTVNKDIPAVGFIAHLDTAPNAPGKNVKPQIYQNYKGDLITFPENPDITLSPEDTPYLKKCVGDTIVTADGTTLLGGDDKAGIAIIMTAVEYLINHPEISHGDIKVCFTPDEEIGQGTEHFDIDKFNTDFAYTVDGHMPGKINKETFSADMITIKIKGKDIHPGEAKNVMVNSIRIASDIIAELPKNVAPETTEGYEPYIHPFEINGTVELTKIKILLRSFKLEDLELFKAKIEKSVNCVHKNYPSSEINIEVKHQYKNMFEYLKERPEALDILWKSVKETGITPEWKPVRGGTDGSRLSEKGLPTPNIFAGCENSHSLKEYASLNAMENGVKTLVNIAQNCCKD